MGGGLFDLQRYQNAPMKMPLKLGCMEKQTIVILLDDYSPFDEHFAHGKCYRTEPGGTAPLEVTLWMDKC